MNTRDQLAFACKATWCSVNGKSIEIFKDPKTVTGTPKKSHRGLIMVVKDEMVIINLLIVFLLKMKHQIRMN